MNLKERIKESKVIFFDLDGTLIDTEPLYFRFWKEGCAYYDYNMSDEEALNMRSLDVRIAKEYLKEISNGLLDYDLVKAKRIENMSIYLKDHPIKVKDYVFDVLTKLNKENKDLYIVTANKIDKAEKILNETRLSPYFKGIISAKDVEHGKPYPDVYLYASKDIDVPKEDIIVFEDSPNGIISAKKAGLVAVLIVDLTEPNKEKEYIDYVIHSWSELL